jgi:hypothetical protein
MSLSAVPVRSTLTILAVVLAAFAAKEGSGAQAQSLSRITPQQVTRLLQLPANVAIYEPPAECYDLANSQCSGMDRAKKMFANSDDGSPQLSECKQMRLFRFAGIQHLNLVISLCQQGPFTLPELNETKNRAQRVAKRFIETTSRLNPDNKLLFQSGESRTVSINSQATAHIFTVLWFGHGVGVLPTAVIISPLQNDTFVIQFLIVPETSNSDPENPIVRLLSKTNDMMESLVKELYPTTF